MSLFLAIRPGPAAIEHLTDAVERVRRMPPCGNLRWQAPGNWHVTLAFLGHPESDAAHDVADRLEVLCERPAIEQVRLSGAGHFGRRVLWSGVADEGAATALGALAATTWSALRGTGVRAERHRWRPHLTLARARHGDVRSAVTALAEYSGPVWPVADLLLVTSTGGPDPTHSVLETYPLARPDRAGPIDPRYEDGPATGFRPGRTSP